jgi:hypothetical protein
MLSFKILLSITNIPAHVWLAKSAQVVLGSSCLVFKIAPCSLDHPGTSSYLIVA